MSDPEPREEPETINDELADEAAELILEAEEQLQQNREAHDEFLDTVAEEEGAETLETECTLVGDYIVNLSAKLNGDVMDAMGRIDGRLERIENGEARAYEISETADEISQVLADVIDGSDWSKDRFYAAYEAEGIDPLGVMLERVFSALEDERERREGVADGFRQK